LTDSEAAPPPSNDSSTTSSLRAHGICLLLMPVHDRSNAQYDQPKAKRRREESENKRRQNSNLARKKKISADKISLLSLHLRSLSLPPLYLFSCKLTILFVSLSLLRRPFDCVTYLLDRERGERERKERKTRQDRVLRSFSSVACPTSMHTWAVFPTRDNAVHTAPLHNEQIEKRRRERERRTTKNGFSLSFSFSFSFSFSVRPCLSALQLRPRQEPLTSHTVSPMIIP
jgi:hypothetical protein